MNLGPILQAALTYFVKPSHILTGMVGQTPATVANKPLWIRIILSKLTPLILLLILSIFIDDQNLDAQLTNMACEMQLIDCGGQPTDEDFN